MTVIEPFKFIYFSLLFSFKVQIFCITLASGAILHLYGAHNLNVFAQNIASDGMNLSLKECILSYTAWRTCFINILSVSIEVHPIFECLAPSDGCCYMVVARKCGHT